VKLLNKKTKALVDCVRQNYRRVLPPPKQTTTIAVRDVREESSTPPVLQDLAAPVGATARVGVMAGETRNKNAACSGVASSSTRPPVFAESTNITATQSQMQVRQGPPPEVAYGDVRETAGPEENTTPPVLQDLAAPVGAKARVGVMVEETGETARVGVMAGETRNKKTACSGVASSSTRPPVFAESTNITATQSQMQVRQGPSPEVRYDNRGRSYVGIAGGLFAETSGEGNNYAPHEAGRDPNNYLPLQGSVLRRVGLSFHGPAPPPATFTGVLPSPVYPERRLLAAAHNYLNSGGTHNYQPAAGHGHPAPSACQPEGAVGYRIITAPEYRPAAPPVFAVPIPGPDPAVREGPACDPRVLHQKFVRAVMMTSLKSGKVTQTTVVPFLPAGMTAYNFSSRKNNAYVENKSSAGPGGKSKLDHFLSEHARVLYQPEEMPVGSGVCTGGSYAGYVTSYAMTVNGEEILKLPEPTAPVDPSRGQIWMKGRPNWKDQGITDDFERALFETSVHKATAADIASFCSEIDREWAERTLILYRRVNQHLRVTVCTYLEQKINMELLEQMYRVWGATNSKGAMPAIMNEMMETGKSLYLKMTARGNFSNLCSTLKAEEGQRNRGVKRGSDGVEFSNTSGFVGAEEQAAAQGPGQQANVTAGGLLHR
jgi:hypothetical protein